MLLIYVGQRGGWCSSVSWCGQGSRWSVYTCTGGSSFHPFQWQCEPAVTLYNKAAGDKLTVRAGDKPLPCFKIEIKPKFVCVTNSVYCTIAATSPSLLSSGHLPRITKENKHYYSYSSIVLNIAAPQYFDICSSTFGH